MMKDFKTKEELFAYLKSNKADLIQLKKGAIKYADGVPLSSLKLDAVKFDVPSGKIAAVINTTNLMDSHSDVHINGIWNKSIIDQAGKVYYIINHELELGKVIAYPKDVEMKLIETTWKDLGANYEGNTQALVFFVEESAVKLQIAKEAIENKEPVQHSIRMAYVDYKLAMDSNDEDHNEEKAVWDQYLGVIANQQQAIKQGYFWAVTEAKIYKEGSMVLAGSNEITPIVYPKNIEPSNDTHKIEPPLSTQINSHKGRTLFY